MRIGFFFGDYDPAAGGGYTFIQCIFDELLKTESAYDIYIFSQRNIKPATHPANVTFLAIDDSSDAGQFFLKRPGKMFQGGFVKRSVYAAKKRLLGDIYRQLAELSYYSDYKNQLNQLIVEHKIDIIWFVAPTFIPVQVPYVFTIWDLAHRFYPFFPEVSNEGWTWESRQLYYRAVLPKATYLVTGTETGRNELEMFYNIHHSRIRVIPLPIPAMKVIDTAAGTQVLNVLGIFKAYLFYPAQFWPHKNHIVILRALNILRAEYHIDVDLVLTGSDKGNSGYVKNAVGALNLSGCVHFLGFVTVDQLMQLYANALCLVFPSFFGPDNLPPLEAMRLGCPVLAARISGVEEQLGDAAILFDPTDEYELAESIRKLYVDTKARRRLIKRGTALSSTRTPEMYLKNVFGIFKEFESYRRCWAPNN